MKKMNEKMVTDDCLDQVCGGKFVDFDSTKYTKVISEYVKGKSGGQAVKAFNLYHKWRDDFESHKIEDFRQALYNLPIGD